MEAVKKQYLLEGLCCGVCAAKIEKEVAGLPGVASSRIDLMSQTLTVELQEPHHAENLYKDVRTVVKRHEAEVEVSEKETSSPVKKVLYLTGLDCANCANKIAAAVGDLPGVQGAAIDFVSGKLTVEAAEESALPRILREAARIASEIEPDVTVSLQKEENETKKESSPLGELLEQWPVLAGAVLFVAGLIFTQPQWLHFALLLAAYLLIGGEVLLRALKNILRGRVFDENFLMALATVGAFAIGQYPEGVAVMLFYQVGEYFQQRAVGRSRASIANLMDVRPDYANLVENGADRRVSPEEVGVGDVIIVRPGEKIPLDGVVLTGTSSLDTSALTGESLPREITEGGDVLSGCVNLSGVLTVKVTKAYGESTVAKILDLVENASSKKAKAEQFITKFARIYTPAVVIAAALLAFVPPLVIPGALFSDWIYRALSFLVVSCPCALVISIPLSFFGGIGGASKQGVLIKGGSYLEALASVDTVVFDKTGTLTKGTFAVTDIVPAESIIPTATATVGNGLDRSALDTLTDAQQELLTLAAAAESYSTHPIAQSVVKAGGEADKSRLTDYREVAGRGVRVLFDGVPLLAGSLRLMEEEGIPVPTVAPVIGTAVHVALNGTYKGYLLINDEPKADSAEAIAALKKAGVGRIVMLTGDNKAAAESVAAKLGITDVYSELLPGDKVDQVEELERSKSPKGNLAFVGDGINDAPVLARADVGIAMGGLGSDAAIEAADVVLMTDEPSKVAQSIRIARRAMGIVRQNVAFSLAVKGVILVLSALGLSTMWEAVFGDVGVALIAVLNAMRALKAPKA